MTRIRSGDRWAAAAHDAVGASLAAAGLSYGASRLEPDGSRTVSWHVGRESPHAPPRRRSRRILLRSLGGDLDRWEVVYSERAHSDDGLGVRIYGARTARCDRAGLAATAHALLDAGLPRARRATVAHGLAPRSRVRVGDPLLGVAVSVVLLAIARAQIALAPSLAAIAVPLLGVSTVWLLAGLLGVTRATPRR